MAYYKYHVFVCTNQRDEGRQCCASSGGGSVRDYLKDRTKALGMAGPGGVRINSAGCFGRCGEGPVMVVYPDAVWYSYAGEADAEEILQEHLVNGRIVERLKLPG
ncbi:(2Fe-2S) ferredoxin domain-containing protein [Imhoffiella purpurea]|nr:(2Fe-2S) ferredoxin domain-containing protein [Imhoffiella purpurea]